MSYERVAENSKCLAEKYADEGNFGRAFSHYLVALKLRPEWRTELREEFSTVLCKWGSILDQRRRFNDLFMCYEQAVQAFPDDTVILNNLGAHLVRCGLLKEAAHYFRKCLTINPHFIRAARNLENVSNLAVERWHFRMLNDKHRNEAFRKAIVKKIEEGFDCVLDVGTGTGILSLFASEGKAREVYACDSSTAMMETAVQVFRANNAADVKLINKHSSELRIPEDVREKVSLLVTETFDAGLLGEGIIDTLCHAWEHLLRSSPPSAPGKFGVVVPLGASVYVTGIELDEFANDLHLKENSLPFGNTNLLRNCENYDTHDLSRTRHKRLTNTRKVFEVDFNDPDALEEFSKGKTVEVSLKCTCSGRLDCFAVWFDLHLDEDTVVSTSPMEKLNAAWDQAIFPLPRSRELEQERELSVSVGVRDKKLVVSCNDTSIIEPVLEASEDLIKILNDEKLVKVSGQLARKISNSFRTSVSILDLHSFPVFGLSCLIERKDRYRDELCCFVVSEGHRRAVEFFAEKHGVKVDATMVEEETCLKNLLQDRRFDVVVLDLVESNGEIRDGILQELNYWKSLLKSDGVILPEEAVAIGQFVYSDWLWKASEVIDDSVTCGYKIAEYINMFKVQHFIDLDLKSVESAACSEPFELFSLFDSIESVTEKVVPRLCDSLHANAMAYWFKIKFSEGCDEILTLDATSFHQAAILFSKFELFKDIKFNVIRSDGLFNIEFLKR